MSLHSVLVLMISSSGGSSDQPVGLDVLQFVRHCHGVTLNVVERTVIGQQVRRGVSHLQKKGIKCQKYSPLHFFPRETRTRLNFHGLAGSLHESRNLHGLSEDGVMRDLGAHDPGDAAAGVDSHPEPEPVSRLVLDFEGHDLCQKVQGHFGNLGSVVVVLLRHPGRHHVRVSNRLHLKDWRRFFKWTWFDGKRLL